MLNHQLRELQSRLLNIRDYEAYSWNNDRQYIQREVHEALKLIKNIAEETNKS